MNKGIGKERGRRDEYGRRQEANAFWRFHKGLSYSVLIVRVARWYEYNSLI